MQAGQRDVIEPMPIPQIRPTIGVTLAATLILLASCGAPQSCEVGGTADEAEFSRHFDQIVLVVGATGEPGRPGNDGPAFATTDEVILQAVSLDEVSLRACVEERTAGGQIPFDDVRVLPEGEGSFSVGSFPPGSYVVRVIVDNTLVINLPFSVE